MLGLSLTKIMRRLSIAFLCSLLIFVRAGPTPRVAGGKNAVEGQFPYQVQLIESDSLKHVCGASVVHKRWILTAAHCLKRFSPDELAVVVGAIKRIGGNGKQYRAELFAVNKNYTTKPGAVGPDNDIALIRLNEDLSFDKNVQQIKLFESSSDDILTNSTVTLTGWGSTRITGSDPDVLQYINLKVLDHRVCNETWVAFIDQQIIQSKICTTSEVGQGVCYGDSGSPLVINGSQVGIVSYGWPCATGVPDVFTRVSSYIGFIKDIISTYDDDFI